MSLESALSGLITGDGGVAALIGTRLYPDVAPQDCGKPYAVYMRVSSPRDYTQSGASGLSWPRIQLTSTATTFDGARAVAVALRSLLSGYKGTTGGVVIGGIFIDNERGDYHDGLNEYKILQDLIVYHQES